MAEAKTLVPCQWVSEGGEECDGNILVELEWIPGEIYGSDADGNRGIWIDGYWSWTNVADVCTKGHKVIDSEQYGDVAAGQLTNRSGFDYDGPDTEEERNGDV